MDYILHVLITACISGILVLGINLALGVTGLVHLGHIAIAGIGAYTAGILLTTLHAPFVVALAAGIAAGAVVGWIVGLPTRDVRGDAFALATFSAAWVYLIAALSWETLTGGSLGIVGIPRPSFALRNSEFFLLAAASLAVTYAVVARVVRSPFGRVLGAIRDDETAARVFGKRTIAAKRACLAIAGATAGLAGVLTAVLIQFLHPSMFWLPSLIAVLTALILGGVGSLGGSLVGVAILSAIGEGVRFVPFPPEYLGALRLTITALILLTILLFRPRGLFGKVDVR